MWIRIDDTLFENRKLRRLGRDPFLLWLASVVYSGKHLADGIIREHDLPVIAAWAWLPPDQLDAAIATLEENDPDTGKPCWERREDHWLIHDYLSYNPSRTTVEEKRARISSTRRDSGRAGAEARWQPDSKPDGKDHGKPDGNDHGKPIANAVAKPMATGWQPDTKPDGPVPRSFVNERTTHTQDQKSRSFVAHAHADQGDETPETDGTDEITTTLRALNADPTDLNRQRISHTIHQHPATDPIAVALEYLTYRSTSPAELRRDPCQGWQLAMQSADSKGYYQRPPAQPEPQHPPTITPTHIQTWDAIQTYLAGTTPDLFDSLITPLSISGTDTALTIAVPHNQNPEYYAGRLADSLHHAYQRLGITPPDITWTTQESTT